MTNRTMSWAWQQPLPPSEKLVLLALADSVGEQTTGCPSIARLAARCSLSSRTVRRLIRCLVARNLIECQRQSRGDGSSMANRYRLLCGDAHAVSVPHDSNDTGGGHRCPGTVDDDIAGVNWRRPLAEPQRTTRVPRFPELARVIG